MADAADFTRLLVDEARAKQRQYLLANNRARWGLGAFGVVLLMLARLTGLAPVPLGLLTGFGLATAIRVSQGTAGWTWSAFAQETVVLTLVAAVLVPTLTRFTGRLRATRAALARVEQGDLTVTVEDEELDDLGFLGVSVNRTTAAIGSVVQEVQQQSHDLASLAQELAASAQELQAASQEIAATAQRLSEGTSRQRQLIGHGRDDSEAAADVAAQLHTRAQDAERRIAAVAHEAQRHGHEIARASELLVTLVDHLDQVSRAAGTLEQGSREIGKLVD